MVEFISEVYCILKGQFGSGAYGKMCGMSCIAKKHDIPERPLLTTDPPEIKPHGRAA